MTLTKTGDGTQTLTGANSYSGATRIYAGTLALAGASGTALNSAFTVRGGTLSLDNSTAWASRLTDGTALSLGSLTLSSGNGAGVQSETVGATTFAVGGKVTINNGTGGSDQTTLALGAVTRSAGAAIDFVGVNGTLGGGGAGSPNVTSTGVWPGTQNSILPWATVGGTQWAQDNGNSIRAFPASFATLGTVTSTTQAQQTGAASPTGAAIAANSLNVIADGSANILDLGNNVVSFGNAVGSVAAILKSGANPYTISATGSGSIRAGTGGAGTELIAHVDDGDLIISAPLNTAIVNIAKGGAGKLVLSGTRNNNMTAGTGGISGNISISGTLEFQGLSTLITGPISGPGGIIVNLNAGQKLIFNNYNKTYSGPTVVKSGLLQLGSGYASQSWSTTGTGSGASGGDYSGSPWNGLSNLELNGGQILMYYYTSWFLGSGPGQIKITGGTSGFSMGQGGGDAADTLKFNSDSNYEVVWGALGEGAATGYFNPSTLVLSDDIASPASSFRIPNKFDLNGTTRTIAANSATQAGTLLSVIRNSGSTAGITKIGVGELLLNAANTYDGVVTISAGTLNVASLANGGSASGLGTSSSSAASLLLANGTTLKYSGGTANCDRTFTINGAADGDTVSLDASGTGAINFSNPAAPNYGTTGKTRTLILTGSYAGANNTLAANITDNGGASVSVTKTGAGLWVLSGASSAYTGPTTISNGTLSVSATANLGAGSANLVFSGGTLQITGAGITTLSGIGHTISVTPGAAVGLDIPAGNTFTVDQALGGASFTKAGAGTLVFNQANTYTGQTTVNAGTLRFDDGGFMSLAPLLINGGTFAINKSGIVTQGVDVPSVIGGAGSLSYTGNGTLVLNSPWNYYTGTTKAGSASSTVKLGHNLAIQNSGIDTTGTGVFTLDTGITAPIFGGLSGASGNLASLISNYDSLAALTLNPQSGITFTYGGVIANNSGVMTLTKTGAGTQILQSANTYTGATYINAGTLTLSSSGDINQSSGIVIQGGTLTSTRSTTGITPFGANSLDFRHGTLSLAPATAGAYAFTGVNALAGSTFTYSGGAILGLTRTTTAGNTLSYTVGNAAPSGVVLARSGNGTLQISPTAVANLGAAANFERFVVNGLTTAANKNGSATSAGIYDASVVAAASNVGTFLSYGTGAGAGFAPAAYTTRAVAALFSANEISDVTASITATDLSNPYALRVGAFTLTLGGTLTVNGGASGAVNSGLGGVILNSTATASTITGGTLTFGSSEGVIFAATSGAGSGTIASKISGSAGITKFGPGTLVLSSTTSDFTGGVRINQGTLSISANTNLGNTGNGITFNGNATLASGVDTTLVDLGLRPIVLNNGAVATFFSTTQTRANMTVGGAVTGSGGVTAMSGGNWGKLYLNSTANTFTGAITDSRSGNDGIANARFSFNSIADGVGYGNIILNGAADSGIDYGSGAITALNLDNRQLILANNNTIFFNNASSQAVNINTDIGFSGTGARQIRFGISGRNGSGINTINGRLTDNAGGVFTPTFGAGTWVLSGANTYSGVTMINGDAILSINSIANVNAGASALGAPTTAANGTIAIGSTTTAGTLKYTGSGHTSDRVINLNGTTGGVTLDQSGTGLLKFTSNFSVPGAAATDQRKTLTLQGSSAGTGEIAGIIPDATAGTAGQLAISVTKSGTGAWTLSGVNTYSGNTRISGGVLQAVPGTGLSGSSYLQLDGGVLQANGSFTRVNSTTAGGANFQWMSASGGGFSAQGSKLTVTVNNSAATEQTWGTAAANNGIWGTLKIGSATANAETEFQNSINLNAATRTVDVTAGAGGDFATLSGVIRTASGTAGLTKTGAGTLVLSGANTFNGVVTVSGGTLSVSSINNVASANPLGQSSAIPGNLLLANGTTLKYTGGVASCDRAFTINGTGAGDSATIDASGSGALNLTSTTAPAFGSNNQTRTLVLAGSNTDANTLAAPVGDNGSGATSLTKSDAGTWVLTATHTFSGSTTISGGTLQLGSGGAAGALSASSAISVASGTIFAVNRSDTVTQGSQFSSAGISGEGGFSQIGGGTTVLNVANDYTGPTTVSAGTLLVNNTLASSAVAVNGGTLGGSGTISGSLTVGASGSVAPGASAGTVGTLAIGGNLDISALANGGSGKLNFDLDTTGGSDTINVTGTLSIDTGVLGFSDFDFNNLAGFQLGTYTLIHTTGGITGSLDDLANLSASMGLVGGAGARGTLQISLNGKDLELVVSLDVVAPEVTTPVVTGIDTTIATVGATITGNGGAEITSRGTTLSLTSGGNTENPQTASGTATGAFTDPRTGLSAGGHYYAWGWAINSIGTGYTAAPVEFYTEPDQATLPVISNVQGTQVTLSWTASGTMAGAIVLMKLSSAVDADPVDGTAYTANSVFGSGSEIGTGNRVVYVGSGNSVTITGLTPLQSYYVKVYAYAGAGAGLINYQQDAPLAANTTTTTRTLLWDANALGVGQTDGAGNWVDSNQWYDSIPGANATWNNAYNDNATIGNNNGIPATITLGTVVAGSVTFGTFSGTYTLSGGSLTVNSDITVGAASSAVTISTPVHGIGGIVKNGSSSTLTLSGANSFTGNMTINDGTLSASLDSNVSNPVVSPLGNPQTAARLITIGSVGILNFSSTDVMGDSGSSPVVTLIANGGTIRNTGAVFNTLGQVQLNGGTLSSYGGINATYPSFALKGTITVGGSAVSTISSTGANSQIGLSTGGTTFDVADAVAGSGSDLDVTGVLANWGGGAGALIKTGGGTMTLSGLNTYTGSTTISDGTLRISGAGVLSTSPYAGAISIPSGATLQYSSSAAQTLSGAISGAGALIKDTNTGDLTLSNAGNTFSGTATVSAGRISVSAAGHLSSGAASLVQSGTGQFYVSAAVTVSNPFNISGTGFAEPADSQNNIDGAIRLTGSTLSGTITLSGNSRIGAYGTSVNTISGKITGAFGIDFYGMNSATASAETFVISNTGNNYTGDTTIYNRDFNSTLFTGSSTTLRLGASSVIPDGASAGNIAFNGADANHLTVFDLYGFSDTINGVTVTAAAGAKITNSNTGASVLTIGANDTTSSFSGTIADGGATKTLALTKTGAGTLTLSGANTYIGATTVNGGTLQAGVATSAFGNGSAVTLANVSGAILDLNNLSQTIGSLAGGGGNGGNVTLGSATLTFGNATASLTFAGVIDGSGALIKLGTGTEILSGANTYTGNTSINNGILNAGVAENSGVSGPFGNATAAGSILFGGGKLQYSAANQYDYSSRFSTAGSQAISIDVNSQPVTFGAAIQGASTSLTLTDSGSGGALTLSGANTYDGATTLTSGKLNINAAGVALTSGPLGNGGAFNLNGGTIDNTSGSENIVLNVNPITIGGAFAFSTSSGTANNSLTLPGAVSMAADRTVTLNGAGVLTLSGLLSPDTSAALRTLTVNIGATTTTFGSLSIGSLNLTSTATARTDVINGSGNVTISGVVANGTGVGGLTYSGTGTLTLSGDNTYSGLTTLTAGTMTLSGASTGAGGVTLTAGTLNINSAGVALTSGPLGNGGTFNLNGGTIDNTSGLENVVLNVNPITIGGAFAFSTSSGTANNSLTLPGAVSMAADRTVTLNGAGVLTLSGLLSPDTSAASRTLTVNIGTTTTTFGSLSIGSLNLTSTATARTDVINGSGNVTISGVVANGTGVGGLTYSGTGTLTLSGANVHSGQTTVSSGTLLLASSGTDNAIASGALTIGAANNVAATVQYTGTSSDMMGDAGTKTINGRGILDFNGKTDSIGAVAIVSTGATGSNPTPIINTAGGGTLTISTLGITPVATYISQINVGTGTLKLGGTVTFTSATTGQASISGNVDLNGGQNFAFSGAAGTGTGYDLDLNGIVSNGTLTLSSGTGRLRLSGSTANTYVGETTVSAGTLLMNKTANLGTGGGAIIGTGVIGNTAIVVNSGGTLKNGVNEQIDDRITVTVNAGGVWDLNGCTETVYAVAGAGTIQNGTLIVTSSGNNIVLGDGQTINVATILRGDLVYNGTTTAGNFGATLTLDNSLANNHVFNVNNGAAAIDAIVSGTIVDGTGGSANTVTIGTGSGTIRFSGANTFSGQLTVQSGTLSIATINDASANGPLGNSALSVILGSSGNTGTLSYTGATATSTKRFTFAAGGTGGIEVTSGAANLTLSGRLDGTGSLLKTGAGTLTLSYNGNQFTGSTIISNGKVALGAQYALWKSAYDTTGSTGAIGLDLTGWTSPWLGGLAGSVNLATAITAYSAITSLTLNPQTGSSVSYGGVIANGSGSIALNKTGHGTQILTGANSYSGATTVWAGTLALAGASGTALNSAFTVRGGTLELDNSGGTWTDRLTDGTALSLGSLTLKSYNGAGAQTETVGATTFAVGGKVTINNGSTVGDQTTLALGAVTRSVGAATDFVGVNGTLGGGADSPNITSTGAWPGAVNGILPYGTVGGTQWASDNANSVRAYTGSFTALESATSSQNAQVIGSLSLSAARVGNSLNLITSGAGESLSLGSYNLTLGSAAGSAAAILKSGTDAYTISGTGQVRAGSGGAGTELITHVDGGTLTISAPLNTAINSIAKGGAGDLILSGTRKADFNGATSIAGGQLEFRGTGFTLSGAVTGGGGLTVNLNPGQTLTMSNNSNSYAGPTIVKGGYLASHPGMPGGLERFPGSNTSLIGSNLKLEGGVFFALYVFDKDLGDGPNQVQVLAGTSGFVNNCNQGGAASFKLDGGRELVWGSTYFNPTVFVHNQNNGANLTSTLVNGFDLNGATRTILVGDATYNSYVLGSGSVLSGAIRNSSGTAGLTKTGIGRLILSGSNTYNGDTTVSAGILQFNSSGAIAGSGRKVIVANDACVVANYAINNAFLLRLAESANAFVIALGSASVNNLDFNNSGTGANLPMASLGAIDAAYTYSGMLTPNGTTYRLGGGGGTLTFSSALTGAGNSLAVSGTFGGTVNLTSAGNSYGGTTTLSAGGSLVVSGTGVINVSMGIAFNGGALTLTNIGGEGAINRVKDDAPITSNGGTLSYNNAVGITCAETLGTVTLSSGQLNVVEAQVGAASQTLTLSGLTRPGSRNTSVVTFSAAGALPANTAPNMIKVTGATQTPAGQIIAPWATIGLTAAAQTDYAVYDDSAFVVPANIASSAETTWTTSANTYTLSGATTLTGTRTISALRYSGNTQTLALSTFNLETYGLLNGGSGLLTLSGTGALRTPTGGGNLHITTGSSGITVSAPVTDNGGAVNLVKSGSGGTLILSGTLSYSGDTVVNAGTLQVNTANANNDASAVSIVASGATLNLSFAGTDSINRLYIGGTRKADGVYKAVGSAATGTELAQLTGTGTLTVSDTIAPTLAGTAILDDKSGVPVAVGTLVTYTVTFSEDMDATTISAADFGNAGTAGISIGAVTETAADSGVFIVPVTTTGEGSLQLKVNAGVSLKDFVGNSLDTGSDITDDTTIAVDGTAPTLAGGDIVDDVGGGPVSPSTLVTYTVTFSEDMDVSTVDATDFSNAGTATIAIGAVTETAAGVFSVPVTPSNNGSIQLQVSAGALLKDVAGNALDTTLAVLDDTIIAVSGSDSTPPTLAPADMVDNKSGGPIVANTLVTYSVTFSEDMNEATVDAGDFDNAGTATFNIGAVTRTSPGVFSVPVTATGDGTLQLRVKAGAGLTDLGGNPLDTTLAIADNTTLIVDGTAPTLVGSSIVDDKSGGPVNAGQLVTYTVSFSEDMDATTVSAADFGNAGTAVISIGAVTETAPNSGVFTVPVTVTGAGTLQLRVNAGADLRDVVGNALVTSSVILDDTTITVNRLALTWDANNTGAGQTDGTGAWLNPNQWWNSAANQNWSDWSDAVFGNNGNGNAVTLDSLATVNTLTFNSFSGTYTLGSAGQTITLNAGITKSAGGIADIISPVTLGGAQTWLNNSGGLLSDSAALVNGGNLLTVGGTGNTTISGIISGAGGLTKTGSGTLIISNIGNSYFGKTLVSSGVLQVGVGWNSSWSTGTMLANGNLELNGGTATIFYGGSRSLGAGAGQVQLTGGRSGLSAGAVFAWTINNNAAYEVVWGALGEGSATGYFNPSTFVLNDSAASVGGAVTIPNKFDLNGATRAIECDSASNAGILSGVIRNTSGTAGLLKTGPGRLVLSGANTYTGGVTINSGFVQADNTTALGNGGPVTFTGASTLDLRVSPTMGALSSASGYGVITLGAAGAQTLTVSQTTDTAFSGVLQNGSGTLSLTKGGSGALTLSGVNIYTGATTINAGTLLVNGSLAAGSAVSVAGGTLGGSGTIGGNVTVAAAANMAPGTAAAGTLSIGGTLNISALAGGAGKLIFKLDARAATSDKIAVASTLTIGAGTLGLNDLQITNLGGLDGGTYVLISSGGITPGDFLDPNDVTGSVSGIANVQLQIIGNDIVLVIPETEGTVFKVR